MTKRVCSINECEKPHIARGWCFMHYQRWRRHGDPSFVLGKEPPNHGELSRYSKHACRCGDCRAASTAYMREWRRKKMAAARAAAG